MTIFQLLLFIIWIVVGVIAGALAKKIYVGNRASSKLTNIIVGLIGACGGGILFVRVYGQLVEKSTGDTMLVVSDIGMLFLGTTIGAIAGAVALVLITGIIKSKKQTG